LIFGTATRIYRRRSETDMGHLMESFIHNENLKLWRKQLSETTDPKKRSLLLDLIAKQEAREDEIEVRAKAKSQPQEKRP
jgi:predicted AAA+ superfamily ATPase